MKNFFKSKYKKATIVFGVVLAVAILVFATLFIIYTQELKNTNIGVTTENTTENIVENEESTSLVSTTEDKSVNDTLNSVTENIVVNSATNEEENSTSVQSKTSNVTSEEVVQNDTDVTETVEEEEEAEPVSFIAPVSGEIITDYADESLIYSATLEEWTTHLGIDIKADKASIVVASEDGVVKSIKNDPRYGLTITISHNENFETVYSNLLSSEFVNEGDTVTQGQTIGTVGESASFEIADVPHLHFEMYKDGVSVNPTVYLND